MANSYQLVAWTDKGRVKMIPSEISAFIQEEQEFITRIEQQIGYHTWHEVPDIIRLSRAYERLAIRLEGLGMYAEALVHYAEAADCCLNTMDENWIDRDYDFTVCRPLRGRFFAMFSECQDMVRCYPELRYVWENTGLEAHCESITRAERAWRAEFQEAMETLRVWNFGKNEVKH